MTKDMNNDIDLDALFAESKAQITPSEDLMARVLGDAATVGAGYARSEPRSRPKTRWQFLAPIFGAPGLVTLGLCAVLGIGAGFGFSDALYEIPGMGQIIAMIDGNAVPNNPYYTLELLMTES